MSDTQLHLRAQLIGHYKTIVRLTYINFINLGNAMKQLLALHFTILILSAISVAMAGTPVPKTGQVMPASNLHKPVELQWIFIYRKPIRARNLMTPQERREYRQAMRAANSPEARQQIRELAYNRLNQRATEWGMVMIIPGNNMHVMREDTKPENETTATESSPIEHVAKVDNVAHTSTTVSPAEQPTSALNVAVHNSPAAHKTPHPEPMVPVHMA
ncbi:hypothetical protein TI03_03585, partial [Achromatium sp. WMS1]